MEEAQAKTNDIRDTIKAEILVREVEGLTAGTYICPLQSLRYYWLQEGLWRPLQSLLPPSFQTF